jgi:hypothetical protein
MNQRISLQELIAVNNTPKAKALIVKYGYKPARSYNDLIKKLTVFTREHREDALRELVDIHPHKDLILGFNESVISEQKSNCNGDVMCDSCMAKQKTISFDGTPNTSINEEINKNQSYSNDWKSMLPLILITSLVTASLVMSLNKSR